VGYADVSFADLDDTYVSYGAELTLDTRADPAFPRNAVLATASWEGLDFEAHPTANRYRLDGRGYLGLIGSTVLAVRATYETADRELPSYLTPLLGGIDTLRGFRAGSFADDNLFAASAEIRVPFTSPMRIARTGFTMFTDVGATYPRGVALSEAAFHTGVGGGLFLIAPVIRMRVDVGYGLDSGTRGHFALGIRF
jgi:outer membrane protein assembly factor BamA